MKNSMSKTEWLYESLGIFILCLILEAPILLIYLITH